MILFATRIDWPQIDITSTIIGICILIAIITLLVISNRFSTKTGTTNKNIVTKRKYSKWVFHRMASNLGLSRNQVKILETLIRTYHVRQPFLIFSNARLLDFILKKQIYSIATDMNIQNDLKNKKQNNLFQIKQIIERNTRKGIGITSTHLIRPGQTIIFVFSDGKHIQSRIINNFKKMLTCYLPSNAAYEKWRWKKNTRLNVLFWREKDSGYSFMTRILGVTGDNENKEIFIQHSNSLKRNQQRIFRRRPVERICFFYPIEIFNIGKGRKMKKRAVVHYKLRHSGNIMDICVRGCSISCHSVLDKGRYLKIEFKLDKSDELSVFGKVCRVTKNNDNNLTMHIIFTKFPAMSEIVFILMCITIHNLIH